MGFVSGCMAGLRHRHDSLPKSKESQIRALEKGRHQHSSSNFSLRLIQPVMARSLDQLQCGLGLQLTIFRVWPWQENGHVTKLRPGVSGDLPYQCRCASDRAFKASRRC